jgi:hypothetical protein
MGRDLKRQAFEAYGNRADIADLNAWSILCHQWRDRDWVQCHERQRYGYGCQVPAVQRGSGKNGSGTVEL